MIIREAALADIAQMQVVRNSVRENVLSNPALVRDEDYAALINGKGKGWVAEIDGNIAGFAFVDLESHNIWALFMSPYYEKQGVGKRLHDIMLHWYFRQTQTTVWLGTEPGTRAEGFYRKAGWVEAGMHGKEIKFEMSFERWNRS